MHLKRYESFSNEKTGDIYKYGCVFSYVDINIF